MAAKTTAVITCRNYGRFLRQAVESALSQTRPFDEIILIDDDSSDETFQICDRFFRANVRYERGVFGNQMAARNHGVSLASGDFVLCLDADDWLAPDFLERMLPPLLSDPKLGLTYCRTRYVREEDSRWFTSRGHFPPQFDRDDLWVDNYIPSPSLVRRSAWRGGKREYGIRLASGHSIYEDWDHWLEMTAEGWTAHLVDSELVNYRIHGGNCTREAVTADAGLQTFRWGIQKRHLTHGLTIIVLYALNGRYPGSNLAKLRRLKKETGARVLFVDGRNGAAGGPAPSLFDQVLKIPLHSVKAYSEWVGHALYRVRGLAKSNEVLLIDGDLSLTLREFRRLTEGRLRRGASFYSARIIHDEDQLTPAWRAVRGVPAAGVRRSAAGNGARRVFATELDLVLMSGETFQIFPWNPGSRGAFHFHLGDWAWEAGNPWYIDGRISRIKSPAESSRRMRRPSRHKNAETRLNQLLRTGARHFRGSLKKARLPEIYQWLPLRRGELFLRTAKALVTAGDRAPVPGPFQRHFGSRFGKLNTAFKTACLQWSFIRELKAHLRSERGTSAAGAVHLHFAADRHATLRTLAREGFWDRADGGTAVLYIENAAEKLWKNWYEFLLQKMGGTCAWYWHPRLVSLMEWRLFPKSWLRIGAVNDLNRAANFRRLEALLPGLAAAGITLGGNEEKVREWSELLRRRGMSARHFAVAETPQNRSYALTTSSAGPA